jgi:hypothetical protein
VRKLVDEDVLSPVAGVRIAEQVLLGARGRVAASSREAPGRFIFEYSGMSIVISTSAMTPVRHLRAISAWRRSGRFDSIEMTMSRATRRAASGTFSDESTGIPCASTYFL